MLVQLQSSAFELERLFIVFEHARGEFLMLPLQVRAQESVNVFIIL